MPHVSRQVSSCTCKSSENWDSPSAFFAHEEHSLSYSQMFGEALLARVKVHQCLSQQCTAVHQHVLALLQEQDTKAHWEADREILQKEEQEVPAHFAGRIFLVLEIVEKQKNLVTDC